jgi:hypothetical protein
VQAKERHALNRKRFLCIGGSIAAIVVLILVMTGSAKYGSTALGKKEDLSQPEDTSGVRPRASLLVSKARFCCMGARGQQVWPRWQHVREREREPLACL